MPEFEQLPLFGEKLQKKDVCRNDHLKMGEEIGTFKDNLQAPIHNWFRYPAGYSHKFVSQMFKRFDMGSGDWVYDPFSGTGTTLVCAKQQGINGYGVEAHSFIHWVAEVKLFWEYEFDNLQRDLEKLLNQSRKFSRAHFEKVSTAEIFPELIYKCYHPHDLKELVLRRFFWNESGWR